MTETAVVAFPARVARVEAEVVCVIIIQWVLRGRPVVADGVFTVPLMIIAGRVIVIFASPAIPIRWQTDDTIWAIESEKITDGSTFDSIYAQELHKLLKPHLLPLTAPKVSVSGKEDAATIDLADELAANLAVEACPLTCAVG